jgi:hypothetical protein
MILRPGKFIDARKSGGPEASSCGYPDASECGRSFEISVENLEAAIFFGVVAAAAPSVLHLTALGPSALPRVSAFGP